MFFKFLKFCRTIIVVFVIVLGISMVFPIKFCLSSIPTNSDEDFYVIRYYSDINDSYVIGDKNGMYSDEDLKAYRIRSRPAQPDYLDSLSVDLYRHRDATTFIVYGNVTIDESWEKEYGDTGDAILYTIDFTDWDILGDVKSSNKFRNYFPKKYLTIYDYRWFDLLRDRLFYYLDGDTFLYGSTTIW